jgi:nucleoside phosphorylase
MVTFLDAGREAARMKEVAEIRVTEQEMSVHVFAHAGGPNAAAAWRRVQALWLLCHAVGMTEPVATLGIPAALPTNPPRCSTVVAVCQSPDTHLQAVLRVEHDVLVVSLLAAHPNRTWAALEPELTALVGDHAGPGVFGSAWLYLGKTAEPPAAASAPITGPGGDARWCLGADLESGVTARELGTRVDTRSLRRLLVLAPSMRDLELGRWTWSDGTPAMPALARYLMHMAKVRYQVRVHADFPGVDPLCREAESAMARMAATEPPDRAARQDLTRVISRIAAVVTALRTMQRTVEIARYNAALVLERAPDPEPAETSTLFGDDDTLARHFLLVLDDDRAYLENQLDGAKSISELTGADETPSVSSIGHPPADERGRSGPPTFGILTALPAEFVAMRGMLNVPAHRYVAADPANYVIGTMPSAIPDQPHTVVLTMLGETGTNAAADGTANLARSFGTVNCVLMVGIAAGVPNLTVPHLHVRLGDIVVASWSVIDYDHVVETPNGARLRQTHPRPSPLLGHAAKLLAANELEGRRPWEKHIDTALTLLPDEFARPDPDTDLVYSADDDDLPAGHPDPALSGHRTGRPKVHHGRVGSADRSLRSLAGRNAIAAEHDLRAVEMEGTGVGKSSFAGGREWFMVRGISDYGDRRTGIVWWPHAALVAAAYTKALLAAVPPLELHGDRFRLPEK